MKKAILFLVLFALIKTSSAQDLQYSQFYAAPLYLNPALTGMTELTRMGLNYRKQWPGLNYDFQGYSAFLDHYSFDLKSGFGISLNAFEESNLGLKLMDFSGYYSYQLMLSDIHSLRFGAQAGVGRRSSAMDHLLLGDQIDVFSKTVAPVTLEDLPPFEPYSFLDLGFGAMFTGENYWLGASAYHVNRPNLSFYSSASGDRIAVKWNAHAGLQLPLRSGLSVYEGDGDNMVFLAANYKQQGPFQQLDLSTQLIYNSLVLGVGFRGIPSSGDLPNRDSIIALVGVSLESGLLIGYSFDYMISRLGMETHGAHEISIRYQFLKGFPQDRDRKSRILKCFRYMM
ncbi:MAG TPA: PorP/SprF family type IX secretion system membrane protein [Lunatimonas sp.]|nr:PorP/SprF family type IX secretion system membrane protein [Lunatimonas sp.]